LIRSRDVVGEFAVESQQLAADRRADHLSQIRCGLDSRRGFWSGIGRMDAPPDVEIMAYAAIASTESAKITRAGRSGSFRYSR
jgi:hypothetical protein